MSNSGRYCQPSSNAEVAGNTTLKLRDDYYTKTGDRDKIIAEPRIVRMFKGH